MQTLLFIVFAIAILLAGVFLRLKLRGFRIGLEKKTKDMDRRMYELAILKELGERIGYSLNVQKIVDIITGSLRQFIDYSVVSYMLLEPEKIIFKADVEKSVSHDFIDEIKQRMLRSLSALLNREFKKDQIDTTVSGAVLVDDLDVSVLSFFNIPLIIGEVVVGVLTVAHSKEGLYKEEEMTILYKITKQASDAVTRLQEVVKTEQSKLNAMVESITEGVLMTDKDYRVVVMNPAAKNAVGIAKNTEITIFDFIDNLDGKFDIRGKLEESIKLEKISMATDILLNDHFFQIIVSPVKSALGVTQGEILGGVVIFHDITHEKEMEKLREDFTSMMVHELRSPLDGIKKLSELLLKQKVKRDMRVIADSARMINDSSSQILELVNDLLDVAKLESNKFEINKTHANIKDLIEGRIQFFTAQARKLKIKLSSKLDKSLLKEYNFDVIKISQVLNNLISNALKFTNSSGQIEIQVVVHKNGKNIIEEAKNEDIEWWISSHETNLENLSDCLVIAVTDTGVGIAGDKIKQLFNKFKQFRETSVHGERQGTGLGLAIVKGIIDAHGGVVGGASLENKGSTFYFTLPIG
ncbi:MAG: ATP-binding protein [bacterium]|nr:ATP-binding protein [bacterium]